ncbi:MAG: hypothetical protein B6D57_04385 [Candidatus Coatesbacteria bacterium 4484_99]|uniref:Transcriptional regulator MraZ n=1 Tax=Candidatus Coatesbacteria bacterium 4484_99 TaxID=1970774 RepID=A0A1W9S1N1_9BACT|nr:MAG: hypothetical protein B6D57_04385 [Candidatus Coatesbacteria bacterium 4484_99]RLC40918.1 MAG: hypothetical protein DRH51_04415 [Candidatus Coatesbacteria bacterium]RLC43026.1 MAG: hypothetical protein DRH49_02420 [Candidatus Coatesbacteria bacterium]RLC44623.1 MAG: hypothetical protein DRH44_01710 [Candidatus Coatesbacteria bacterium]
MNQYAFIGQYRHAMDDKGRILIPKPFRSDGDGNQISSYVLTMGYEPCLCLFPKRKWLQIVSDITRTPPTDDFGRLFLRKVLSRAVYQNPDKIGRIIVPQELRSYAELDSDVFINGVIDKIEIWDITVWEQYMKSVRDNKEELDRKFMELGF